MNDPADETLAARVLHKVTWRLTPFLGLLYIFNILDRANVGFARLTMQPDLGISEPLKSLGTDVPTLVEAGVPGYEATIWIGMVSPKGTPQPIVDRLNGAIDAILTRPDIKASWEQQDAKPDPMTPAQFGEHIQAEIAKWAKLIKANNIKAK